MFDLYKPANDYIIKKFHRKGLTPIQTVARYVKSLPNHYQTDVAMTYGLESILVEDRIKVIFPNDLTLWDRLLKADYDAESLQSLHLPDKVFTIAIPKGSKLKPMAFIRSVNSRDIAYQLSRYVTRLMGVPEATEEWIDKTAEEVGLNKAFDGDTITIVIAMDELSRVYMPIRMKNIHLALNDDSGALLRDARQHAHGEKLPEEIAEQVKMAFKLYAGMLVYHSATEGQFLTDGLPSMFRATAAKAASGTTKYRYSAMGRLSEKDRIVGTHTRNWYFRNLKAECYYKGEHESKAPGSRWVFVTETLVKGKAKTAREVTA